MRRSVIVFAVSCLVATSGAWALDGVPQVYDTRFAVQTRLADRIDHGDGTLGLTVAFDVTNRTGQNVSDVVLELSSPILPAPAAGSAGLSALGPDSTAATLGTFTVESLGIADADLLGTVVWRLRYLDAGGVGRICYVKGTH